MNYTISQAAKQMNLTIYTLRYYDREGLLSNVKRDKSGNRILREIIWRCSHLYAALRILECLLRK